MKMNGSGFDYGSVLVYVYIVVHTTVEGGVFGTRLGQGVGFGLHLQVLLLVYPFLLAQLLHFFQQFPYLLALSFEGPLHSGPSLLQLPILDLEYLNFLPQLSLFLLRTIPVPPPVTVLLILAITLEQGLPDSPLLMVGVQGHRELLFQSLVHFLQPLVLAGVLVVYAYVVAH